jgi:DNA polymerase III subunit epsilon
MKVLIIDTETSGLDPKRDWVIEIGAVLYSVTHRTTLFQLSTLLNAQENAAELINRIPPAVLPEISTDTQQIFINTLQHLAQAANYAVAHNAAFDEQWFDGSHLPVLTNNDTQPLKWLCTLEDFTFPKQTRPGENLVSLVLNHGIGVSSTHRALTDCQLIAALFDRMDDLEGMINKADRPKALYKALVSYDKKDLAKTAGFKWNAEKKIWTRRMATADTLKLQFPVQEILNSH